MAEIVGAIGAANELLSLFSGLHIAYNSLSERFQKFCGNHEEFQLLNISLSEARRQIKLCDENLQKYQQASSDGAIQYEKVRLDSIAEVLEIVQKNVDELETKLLEKRSRFQKFFKAKGTARKIAKQTSRIDKVKGDLALIIENLKRIVDENDLFNRDFSSIPKLGFPVHLDFSLQDTMEGKLMETLLEQVKQRGLQQGSHITAVVGAKGMGGVGKTTALCKLAQEHIVREAFPDGIHFMVVGKEATAPDLVKKLKRIVRRSGGEKWSMKIDESEPLELAIETTSSWFAGKKVLFICDDLWEAHSSEFGYYFELKELLSHCPESHMIISTRNDKIGPKGSAKVMFEPRTTTGVAARRIFLESAGLNENDVSSSATNDQVTEILKLCRGVPLTLSIAGAQVASHDGTPTESLSRLLMCLEKKRVSLREIKSEKYPCFAEAVKGSLEGIADCLEKDTIFMDRLRNCCLEINMEEELQSTWEFVSDRFHRLSIFPRNARLSSDTIFRGWCVSNNQVGWRILDALKDSHLVVEFENENGEFVFGVHDVVVDHCMEESFCRGIHVNSVFHREFLSHTSKSILIGNHEDFDKEMNAFWKLEECDKFRPWWQIYSNELSVTQHYLLANLFRHLRKGARLAEAVALLSHKEWTQLRINHGGIAALKADFDVVIEAMDTQSREVETHEKPGCAALHESVKSIKSIWKMISKEWPRILNNSGFLPGHAHAYFIRQEKPRSLTEGYLESAERFAGCPWLKPRVAYLHVSDCAKNTFDTTEIVKDFSVMWNCEKIIAASHKSIFWIDVKTMGATHTQELDIDDEIWSIACCKKVDLLALGFESGRIQFRNAVTGKLIKESMNGHEDKVRCLSFSADGQCLVSGSHDRTVRVWDTASGKAVCDPLSGHENLVTSVVMSEDRRAVISGSWDSTIREWSVENGNPVGEPFNNHDDRVTSVAISEAGRKIVSSSYDGTVQLWDTENEKAAKVKLRGHGGVVTSVAVSDDGQTVVCGFEDGTVQLLDGNSGLAIGQPLRGHERWVLKVALSADGQTVVSCAHDGTVRMWNVRSVTATHDPLPEHVDWVTSIGMSADGKTVITGSDNGMVRMWDTESSTAIGESLLGHHKWMRGVATNMDGRMFVSGSHDGSVWVWDGEKAIPIFKHPRGDEDSKVRSVSISADGRTAVCGFHDGTVRVWNSTSGAETCDPLREHEDIVRCVAVSADGRRLLSGSDDGTVRAWDVSRGTAIGEPLLGHEDWVTSVSINSDSRTMVSGSADGAVWKWRWDRGRYIGEALCGTGDGRWVSNVGVSTNGLTVISCNEHELKIWNVKNGDNRWSYSVAVLPKVLSENEFVVGAIRNAVNTDEKQCSSSVAAVACVIPLRCNGIRRLHMVVFDLIAPTNFME